ncbi:tetratricopeptide repeat protein [Nostocoides sp. Soil756]|uniref:tetratricopeptide repeat protein n=1 Tax=Nostocoides sp. Soil756 TaxID=1736399 RepID=UPI0006FF977A|nr:tetratricopeptide repeat protein [Tetrasphaera sp. Soil756]KRE62767.1 Mur ligase [Tetrasphaera sp. Soil756]
MTSHDAEPDGSVLTREVRLLEGPNLYFPRPAAKVTLALPGYLAASEATIAAVCEGLGMRRGRPGAAGSEQRQQVLVRLVERVTRAVASGAGTRRLGVRTRAAAETEVVVCAFVWRHRGRAEALGAALGPTLAHLLAGVAPAEAVQAGAAAVAAAPPGEAPRVVSPRIPVASVTGTNGKTTTTRLLAHLCMTAGRVTAWSSTDGVVVQGETVEPGDYSGPAGARAVLDAPGVQVGILETARGGMLLRGMGVSHNDVSVVTNVSADHLGLQGIDTVDQLAEVKAIVTRVTKPSGWVVLNGEDPRVWAMRSGSRARPWVFASDPTAPAVREALTAGGRATTVLDGDVTVLGGPGSPDRLLPVLDLPMALSGLSHHNVLNALAGASAALGLGIARDAVIEGLRTFAPDDVLNPGRMNTYSVPVEGGSATVVVDLAHNEAGLEALLDVARGLTAPGGCLHLALGTAGDRTDDILQALGEIAGLRADHVVAAHKESYLRGRTVADLEVQLRLGLGRAGVADIASYPTELAGLQACLVDAEDGDVVALMCHAEREDVVAWLRSVGASADDAATIRRKVVLARGEHEAEGDIARLWELEDPQARVQQGAALYAAHPGDARIAYEYGGTHDNAGHEAEAVPLYEEALRLGLREPLRHRAQLQLASSLRNLGRSAEALAVVDEVAARHPESVGVAAFRALVAHDAGDPTGALRGLLAVVAATSTDPDVERYRRALTAYAQQLGR